MRAAAAVGLGSGTTETVLVIVDPVSTADVFEEDVATTVELGVVAGYAQEQIEEILETIFTAHGWVA